MYGEPVTESDSKSDIEKPSIYVKWFDKEISVSWSAAKGATQHILKVFDKKNNLVIRPKTLKHPTANLRMMDACNYGKTCKFVIEVFYEKQKKTAEKSVLIGGDKAVTEVVAKQDVANPRRAIVVEWQPPKQPPQGYRLILYDLGNENTTMKQVTTIEASQTTHRYVELKTETHYCVCVCPIYNGNRSEGTRSNVIVTEKRINLANEQEPGFGQTEKIIHAVKAVSVDQTTIELSWSSVQMGENYKVTGYEVLISQKGWAAFTNTTILKKNVGPKTTSVEADLKKGLKYEVKVSTLHFDLDTAKKGETLKDYEIFTDQSKTVINECGLGEGVIFFTWQPVNGAKKYQLVIKDEYFIKSLVPDFFHDVTEPGGGCSAKIQLSGELRIGRTCMTKVFVYAEGGGISETDWKAHLLGGDTVPRNVEVTRSSKNPKRAVNITFDCPKKGPALEYKIVAFPESGMKKIVYSKTSNAVVEYLRKGITYHFEVYAKLKTGWSKGSPSNSVRMEGDKGKSLMDIHNITGTNVDLTKAILAGQITEINVSLGKDFGQVEDLGTKPKRVRDKDTITLHWNRPSFDKKVSDFKVEMYKVEVWEQHASERWTEVVDFEKHRHEYHSKEFELDLGETYKFAVSTIFLDIDQDYIFKSIAVQGQFHTRPCAPRCIRNDYINDTLTIEWNAAKGAQRYEIEIYADNTTDATFRQDLEKNTIYRREFDENFGFGSTYHVVIKAFGVENISNIHKTSEKIIGGDRVATNVTVTSNHPRVTDRNSEVFLSWSAPECAPKRYEISSFPAAETMKTNITGEECLVSGLKAGTEYYFKVKAVHEKYGKEKFSGGGGSTSKRISTNPTPTQVKKIWADPGQNPSTSVEIFWEKVGAEKENETTKYRVRLTKEDETTKREVADIESENLILQDLEPGSTYFVTVAGGNSMGYGIHSEKVQFKTDIGTPKNVQLLNNKKSLSTSLILEFSKAEGQVTKYVAILHMCRNQIEQPVPEVQEVESGHTYNDLEPNAEYLVKLHAVFATEKGKVVKSKKVMTAPSKTKIIKYGCTVQNEQSSSREIYAEWSSDVGCNCHEVKVICGTRTIESRLFKENNETTLKYLCLNEAKQYLVQVRSRNGSGHFGDWSAEALIHLAPAKLQQVSAELDKNGNDILVECWAALTHSPLYFMRAIDGNEPIGTPIQANAENGVVKWKFTPPEGARQYNFELWGENNGKVEGERAFSNPVISRPPKGLLKNLRTLATSSSTDIEMAWEKAERCDSYEIKICTHDLALPENIVKTSETYCWYRCQSPGNTYLVSVRAIREHVKGDWSEDQEVTLAPAQVQLLEDDGPANTQLDSLEVKWNPLKYAPEGYLLKLFCNNQEAGQFVTTSTNHTFERLMPGSVCYCAISAFNGGVFGQENVSRKLYIGLGKIQNLELQRCDSGGRLIGATWEALEGCESYDVEISRDIGDNEAILKVFETMCSYSCHCSGELYRIRVRGCTKNVCAEWSDEVSIILVPGPVDIKGVTCLNRGIQVQWSKTDQTPDHYVVNLFGKSTLVCSKKICYDRTSHQFDDLLPGHQYYCSISAANAAGHGPVAKTDWTKIAWEKPNELAVRLDPDNPSNHAMFTWDHPDGVNCFKLLVDGMDFHRCFEVVENQYLFENGKPGTKYNCRLHCGCDGQYDPDSVALAQPLIMAPEPPANIKILPDKNPNQLQVDFDEPKAKPDKYRITAFDASNNIEYPGQHIPPHCYFKELSLGKKYLLRIQSDNGEGLVSRTVSSVFFTYPPKVEGLHLLTCANESALVKWTRPSTYVDDFLIQCRCGTKGMIPRLTRQNQLEIPGLKRGRTYHVEVAAKNSTGQGEFSDILEFKTALSNLIHVTVSQSELEPTTSLIVEFKDPNKQSKDYIISAKAKSDGIVVTKKAQQLKAGIQGLRPGETYDVFVHAELWTKVSNTAHAPEPIQTVPNKVTNVTAESNGDRNVLHWPELRYPCSYRVRWKGDTEERYARDEAKIRQGFYEWPLDLKPGVMYEVQVCAENTAGSGEWSDPITFTAVGEQNERGDHDQGNTTMIDGKFDTFFHNARNVHEDKSTHTKMENMNVVNFSFPGITNGQPQVPSLEGATRPAQALMRNICEIMNSTAPSIDTPTTSGITDPPRCITNEPALSTILEIADLPQCTDTAGEHGDANTIPKILGSFLDQDDEQGYQEESIENVNEDSADRVPEDESSVVEHFMECLDRDEPIQSGLEISTVEANDDDGSQSSIRSETRSVGATQSTNRMLSRVFFCCFKAKDDNEQNDPLLENSSTVGDLPIN